MAIRDTFRSLVSRPAARVIEAPVREMVEEILASRSFVKPGELLSLQQRLDTLEKKGGAGDVEGKTEALEAEVIKLQKKLSMAMGALQAATAQLQDARKAAEEAMNAGRQATGDASGARAAAEQAADGVSALEDRLASVLARLEQPEATPTPAVEPAAEAPVPAGDRGCAVPGCPSKHRARGFCAKHYQMFRRSTLPGFVGPDGVVPFAEGEVVFRVDPDLAGRPAKRKRGGKLEIDGTTLEAEKLA